MGQQQLLLIILGVIIVGIAVAVGITMFQDSAVSANRDAVTNDLVNMASRAQQFYRRPTSLGGGGNSFVLLTADATGFARISSMDTNANGTYKISTAGTLTAVSLEGLGYETGNDGSGKVQVTVTVTADAFSTSIDN